MVTPWFMVVVKQQLKERHSMSSALGTHAHGETVDVGSESLKVMRGCWWMRQMKLIEFSWCVGRPRVKMRWCEWIWWTQMIWPLLSTIPSGLVGYYRLSLLSLGVHITIGMCAVGSTASLEKKIKHCSTHNFPPHVHARTLPRPFGVLIPSEPISS